MKHMHKWIKTLTESLDKELDEKTRAKILESCGRNCIPRSFVQKAQACRKNAEDVDDFLDRLGKIWGNLKREGNDVYVVYKKCYCPLVRGYSGKLSPTWCNCSMGWIKKLFESTLEKPVEVMLEKSIKQGDDICRFKVSS